jgi:hypothetical protein
MPDPALRMQQLRMRAITDRPMGVRPVAHLEQATEDMGLNKQEQYLYNHHLDNLAKGGVQNDDGSTSTLLAATVGVDDKTYVIPTVWDNKIVSVDEGFERAKKVGIDKFPSYDSEAVARGRYDAMHNYIAKDLPQ